MREIKFRAWDCVNNQYAGGKRLWDLPNRGINTSHITLENCDIFTFEQYTGLKDKNGVEIYENDLVTFGTPTKFKIVYEEKLAAYYMLGMNEVLGMSSLQMEYVEVIGNIHEEIK